MDMVPRDILLADLFACSKDNTCSFERKCLVHVHFLFLSPLDKLAIETQCDARGLI